ncbi:MULTISPECIES: protein-L-isoaspartate(D-aspartate) O-methyltransferase [unclassified Carboxylicivirga]|uniref:protein-L-isoaspartate(D-aspartate) O-methyltransferase n=1 Tax=Carboxylicivirga TaxID=1628153 RepID=UPI003D339888
MRAEMVVNQIMKRGIKHEATLAAMQAVPRHLFVPQDLQNYAYDDRPLPIGYHQTISQPYIVAYMTAQLQLGKEDKVLEIGTGSGYQAAVLSEIVKEVYTIEIIKPLARLADSTLTALGYNNVYCKAGDGYHGWEAHQPYNAIMITAANNKVPKALFEQLNEGGRLIAPIENMGQQQLVLYTKKNGEIRRKDLLPVRFVPFTRDNN